MLSYTANSITSLHSKEELEVRRALDLKIQIEKEKRRRLDAEKGNGAGVIQPNHLAFKTAFPLRQFVQETFSIMEPSQTYKDNWHIDCLPYEQPILTEHGYMPIGYLVETKYSGNVLSFNHVTGQAEWKKVASHMKNRGSQLYDVVSSKGDKITVTGNHPIFCNGKYIEVSEIQNGDRILRTMPQALFESSVDVNQILWSELFWQTPEKTERYAMPKMRWRQILHVRDVQSVFGSENRPALSVRELRKVELPNTCSHEGLIQKVRRILRPQVFRQLRERREEYGICGRQVSGSIPQDFQVNQSRDYRKGWRLLFSLQGDSAKDGRASRRQGENEQRALELGQSLPTLPQPTKARCKGHTGIGECYVRSVTKSLRVSETVYNIEVEGNNNYFVNGILVHNCMAETLEAATVGDIKKLLINVPRRHMKSSMFSVMWPTWAWTFLPYTKWLFASFNEKFAYRDSEYCMKIIGSRYYQERFGHVFQPSLHTWRKAKLENTKGGVRECFGVGKGTGSGGDFILVDDPHQIDEAESEKVTEKTVRWYLETYYNNVNNPATAVRVIIHQRVSENDLTGAILAKELDYEHLCLPAHYEDDHPHKNGVSKPLKLGKVTQFDHNADHSVPLASPKLWVDPRDPESVDYDNKWYRSWYKKHYESRGLHSSGEGELLWPQQYNEAAIVEMVKHIAAYGESSQLQQRPIRRGGNFFSLANFTSNPVYLPALELNGMSFCRYWDKAGTQSGGDWTVGMLMARTQKRPYTLYIIDIFRKQLGLYERMAEMKRLAEEDTLNYIENRLDTEYTIGIERELASSGKDVSTIERIICLVQRGH